VDSILRLMGGGEMARSSGGGGRFILMVVREVWWMFWGEKGVGLRNVLHRLGHAKRALLRFGRASSMSKGESGKADVTMEQFKCPGKNEDASRS
jgi:hypothetical protein